MPFVEASACIQIFDCGQWPRQLDFLASEDQEDPLPSCAVSEHGSHEPAAELSMAR